MLTIGIFVNSSFREKVILRSLLLRNSIKEEDLQQARIEALILIQLLRRHLSIHNRLQLLTLESNLMLGILLKGYLNILLLKLLLPTRLP